MSARQASMLPQHLALAAALTLTGCSSAGDTARAPPEPRFVTYIDDEGTKHFTLMLDGLPARGRKGGAEGRPGSFDGPGGPGGPGGAGGPPPGGPPPGGKRGGPPEGALPDTGLQEMLRRLLNQRLAETGFCREGHVEFGNEAGVTDPRISGKCNERGTDADRAAFPNN